MTNFHEHIFGLIGYFFKRNIFNILTGQNRDVTELKLVWPVNKTGHYPKIICSTEVQTDNADNDNNFRIVFMGQEFKQQGKQCFGTNLYFSKCR